MEITKKRDGSMKKIIKEKLIKKAYNYTVWLKRQHKKLRIKLVTLKNLNARNL